MKYLIYIVALASLISCKQKQTQEFLKLEDNSIPQLFTINTERDTTLLGSKGTIIKLSKNCFVDNNGDSVVGQVKLELNEFYTTQDFISNRLSTKTFDGRVLKSSGMVFIQATLGDKILSLKDDHPMTIMFKRSQNSKTANLFSGTKGVNKEIKWNLLSPVHNDTIAIRNYVITQISYGYERVDVSIEFVVGKDTIQLSDENEKEFAQVIARLPTTRNVIVDKFFGDSISISTMSDYDPQRFYVFKTTSLGYINCDIFINDELMDFTVKLENNESDVFIILDSLKSVLYPDSVEQNTNEYIFRIPKSKKISVVAYLKENDEHFLGIESANSNSKNLTIEQIKMPLDEVKKMVKKLE